VIVTVRGVAVLTGRIVAGTEVIWTVPFGCAAGAVHPAAAMAMRRRMRTGVRRDICCGGGFREIGFVQRGALSDPWKSERSSDLEEEKSREALRIRWV
jgi:hypothetical protein